MNLMVIILMNPVLRDVVLNPTAPDESGQAILVWRI
jgi:hypothetical protein